MSITVTFPITSIATAEVLELDIRVSDSDWLGVFDHLEIFRSRLGLAGPYEEITGPDWAPARIQLLARPYFLNGKTLSLLVNETEVDIVFSGSDPISAASTASQIQTQGQGLLKSYISGSSLVIETELVGSGAQITVLSSDGAGALGLSSIEPNSLFFGQDIRIALTAGQSLYHFADKNGSNDYYYRARFWNAGNNTVSEFSDPFQANGPSTIASDSLVLGMVDLIDAFGNAARNVRVLLYTRFSGSIVDGRAVIGGSKEMLTDGNGHAEALLVRGSTLTVAIAGTNLARDVTVPTDPSVTSFNLLAPDVGDQDVFQVQVPEYTYADRRSM